MEGTHERTRKPIRPRFPPPVSRLGFEGVRRDRLSGGQQRDERWAWTPTKQRLIGWSSSRPAFLRRNYPDQVPRVSLSFDRGPRAPGRCTPSRDSSSYSKSVGFTSGALMSQQFPPVRPNRVIEKLEGRPERRGQRGAGPSAGTVSVRWR